MKLKYLWALFMLLSLTTKNIFAQTLTYCVDNNAQFGGGYFGDTEAGGTRPHLNFYSWPTDPYTNFVTGSALSAGTANLTVTAATVNGNSVIRNGSVNATTIAAAVTNQEYAISTLTLSATSPILYLDRITLNRVTSSTYRVDVVDDANNITTLVTNATAGTGVITSDVATDYQMSPGKTYTFRWYLAGATTINWDNPQFFFYNKPTLSSSTLPANCGTTVTSTAALKALVTSAAPTGYQLRIVNASGTVLADGNTVVPAGTYYAVYFDTTNNCYHLTAPITVTANPNPTITGTTTVCVNGTTQLTGSGTAATTNPWTSSNTAVATVSSTGLVTGVSAGTTTITYTNSNGCSTTATITVNALPTITGTTTVNVGSTTTLTGSPTGGTWSSATTSVATVNPSTGVVTGVAAGTSVITYTATTGCTSTVTVTVTNITIDAVDDDYINVTVGGTSTYSVLGGNFFRVGEDTYNGSALFNLSSIIISQVSTSHAGVTINTTDGKINVAAGTPTGTYTLVYRICATANSAVCDTATATIFVNNGNITAVPNVHRMYGNNNISNVTVLYSPSANDLLNGVTATTSTVSIMPITLPSGFTIDSRGYIVAGNTVAVGVYDITYKICEQANATNCSATTERVTILANQACYIPGATGTALETKVGITTLKRAGADNGNWPMLRNGGHLVLEAPRKGFVVNRMPNPETAIGANAVEGMMVYDTDDFCLKIYVNGAWKCYQTPTCPSESGFTPS